MSFLPPLQILQSGRARAQQVQKRLESWVIYLLRHLPQLRHVYLQGGGYVVYDGGTTGSCSVCFWQSSLRQLLLAESLVVFKIVVEALRKKQTHNHLAIRLPILSRHFCESPK